MGRLAGKVAIISGGATGMGGAASSLFAAEGAKVAIIDRNLQAAEERAHLITQAGGQAVAFAADVSKADEVEAAVAAATRAQGAANVLFNHAGTIVIKPFLDTTEEEWDWLHAVNVKSMFLMTRAVLPGMIAQGGGGVIINMASIGAIKPIASTSVYWAIKAALISMTKSLAVEWSAYRIRSVAIAPGLVRTDMGSPHIDKLEELGIRRTLLGTFSNAEDVANLALFLASPAGRSANASTFVLDEGTLAMSAA